MNVKHNLNIKEYSFEELLELFNLSYDFSLSDLKECKKKVLFLHPDKSKKPPEYFLFYKKAFEMIVNHYEERNKQKREIPINEMVYVPMKTNTNGSQIEKTIKSMKSKDFNKTFNELFDKNMAVKPDENKIAWFKNDEPIFNVNETVTQQNMNKIMDSIKTQQNDIIKYRGVENMYSSTGVSNSFLYDDNEEEQSYISCDLFSKLKFDDLRKVHKDQTIFSVTENDYQKVKQYASVDHLNKERGMQDITPLEKHTSENIIKRQQDEYEKMIFKKQHQSNIKSIDYESKNKDIHAYFLRLQN